MFARFTVRRITADAVLVALYVVFAAIVSVKLPFVEISFASIPIFVCAMLYGIGDVLAVATLGGFIEQLLGGFGLSATTPLWMAPVILQGVLAAVLFHFVKERSWRIIAAVVLCEVLLTVTNTAALYLDGAIMHYSVKALHLIAPARIINGLCRAAVSACAVSLLYKPLRRLVNTKNRR